MKKWVALLSLLTGTQAFAQDGIDSLTASRSQITLSGMKVLGSWGIVNLGAGAAGWAASHNNTRKYFYQMSTFWGAVNTGIAVLGFAGAKRKLNGQLREADNLKAQQTIEKTFLINGGLDFVYIGAGIYVNSRGNARNDAKLKGYGSSVIMHGVFLLLFDGVMYKLQKNNGDKIRSFMAKNSVTFTSSSIGVMHTF